MKYLHQLQTAFGGTKKPRSPGYMGPELPTSISHNLKKKLEVIHWPGGRAASPYPWVQGRWKRCLQAGPLDYEAGELRILYHSIRECQIHIHKCQRRLIQCLTHQPVCTTEPIYGYRSEAGSNPVSRFRKCTCTLYPRWCQFYRKNLEVWIKNRFTFGKEPFSTQTPNSES